MNHRMDQHELFKDTETVHAMRLSYKFASNRDHDKVDKGTAEESLFKALRGNL